MSLSLIGRISLDARPFDATLRGLQGRAAQVGSHLSRAFAGAISTAAISAQVKKTIDYAGSLQDLADASGIGVEELQEFDHAMRQNGATMDDAVRSARNLAKARAEALSDPAGQKALAFQKVGISREELSTLSDSGQLLKRLGDALKGAAINADTLPGIVQLIGDKAQNVIPALTAGLRELGDEARQAGLIMQKETVAALDKLGDDLDTFGKKVTVGLAPVITGVLNLINAGVDKWEAGMTGILAIFEKVSTMEFKGKGPMGILQELLDAGGLAVIEAQGDIAVRRMQEQLARAKAGRGAGAVKIEPDLQANAEKELDRLQRQIAEKQRATKLAGMNEPEKRALLTGELDQARLAARRNFGLEERSPLEQGRLDLAVATAEQNLASLSRPGGPDLNRFSTPTDSLRSIGNLLGSDPNSKAANEEMREMRKLLEKIADNTKRQGMGGGLQFPSS